MKGKEGGIRGGKVAKQTEGEKVDFEQRLCGLRLIEASRISARENECDRSYRDGGCYEHIPNLQSN
jgi:hypothetical protein